jgi:hypothetical protein
MKEMKKYLTFLAVTGNVVFILWILYNGINEGFKGTWIERVSYLALIMLLAINSFLILGRKRQK